MKTTKAKVRCTVTQIQSPTRLRISGPWVTAQCQRSPAHRTPGPCNKPDLARNEDVAKQTSIPEIAAEDHSWVRFQQTAYNTCGVNVTLLVVKWLPVVMALAAKLEAVLESYREPGVRVGC